MKSFEEQLEKDCPAIFKLHETNFPPKSLTELESEARITSRLILARLEGLVKGGDKEDWINIERIVKELLSEIRKAIKEL